MVRACVEQTQVTQMLLDRSRVCVCVCVWQKALMRMHTGKRTCILCTIDDDDDTFSHTHAHTYKMVHMYNRCVPT